VFAVVISTLVLNTVIEKSPLIFLAIGEKDQGEIDAIIGPANFKNIGGSGFSYPYFFSAG
jgi:hypothetical protein